MDINKVETGMKIAGGMALAAMAVGTLSDDPKIEENVGKVIMISLIGFAALFMVGLSSPCGTKKVQ